MTMFGRIKVFTFAFLMLFYLILPLGCNRSKTDNRADSLDRTRSTNEASQPGLEPSASLVPLKSLGELVVFKPTGEESRLSEYMGKHNLVLIFSRGYFNTICPYCSAQMHALAEAYPQFEQRNARVVVVFPISNSADQETWKDLEASILARLPSGSQLPFPILIDHNLVAVDRLAIREALSKPSTFIVDTSGIERYRYIGSDPSDRPEVATILEKLDGISQR